jgi:hypothetical protein
VPRGTKCPIAQILGSLSSLIVAGKWESRATTPAECGGMRSSPGARTLRLWAGERLGARQGRKGCLRHEFLMRSEQAQIGARVTVGEESGLRSELRGLTGTVRAKWGEPEYLAFDVLLDDGRTLLFWHHELEEIDA